MNACSTIGEYNVSADFQLWEAEHDQYLDDLAAEMDSVERDTEYEDPELAEARLLTEEKHFSRHLDADGNVPHSVWEAVVLNRRTAAAEIGMPYAVTDTEHQVEYRLDEAGRRRRVIMWLGKTALEVSCSGYQYHFSPEAHLRVDIEKAEGTYAEETLRPGVAQVFISPKMTRHDASEAIAKAEHLYADDSLRVSTAITNEQGEVVGRRLRSLLVRDIPFEAWVAMLEDPNNLFGRAFDLRDRRSALSVMELFNQMDLPEEALPEGPVTLVAAVLPYITDAKSRRSVEYQLERFRGDQEFYAAEAQRAGEEWAMFDLELARSLREGVATDSILSFILQNAGAWTDESLETIWMHAYDDGSYAMTTTLAALLARAKQKLLGDELSVITDNDGAITRVDSQTRDQIRANHQAIIEAKAMGRDPHEIHRLQTEQYKLLHQQSIDSGGGCPGAVASAFGNPKTVLDGVGEMKDPFRTATSNEDKYGSRTFSCPRCHRDNYRFVPNKLLSNCQHCSADVGCKSGSAPMPKPSQAQKPTWEQMLGIRPVELSSKVGERALVGASS